MIIEANILKQILVEMCEILSDQYIVTGSCADFFNIGYTQVEDFDLIIEETIYNNLPKENMSVFKEIYTLRHKEDGHILKNLLYKNYGIDLMIKKESLIDKDIHSVNVQNKSILIFGNQARCEQLKNYNYREISPEQQIKYKKMSERIQIYKDLLNE